MVFLVISSPGVHIALEDSIWGQNLTINLTINVTVNVTFTYVTVSNKIKPELTCVER
jgi:hypothetical protein